MVDSVRKQSEKIQEEQIEVWLKAADAAIKILGVLDENDPEEYRVRAEQGLASTYPVQALKSFYPQKLPADLRRRYFFWLSAWEDTSNNYYPVLIFTDFISAGINPPKWVLEIIAGGLEKHLADSDPCLLASQLGLTGHGSGSDSPASELKRRLQRSSAMRDMAWLIRIYGLTKKGAAKAVIDKYKLRESESTIKKYYDMYFANIHAPTPQLSESDAIRFCASFPPKVRRQMKES